MVALSLVTAIGNNDYGNKIYREGHEPAVPTSEKRRTEFWLYTLREAFKNIDYELVIVEWLGNPDTNAERPRDWHFFNYDTNDKHRMRFITVPYEFAHKVCPERPFHETHAKNVGVRRAHANMILTMNNDCLWLDEFPSNVLGYTNDVMVADRPTVYHTVMDECGLDYACLQHAVVNPKNVVHDHDFNANGDFTMMSKDMWYALYGLCTPLGDKLAGVDMWQIVRAEQFLGRQRLLYRHPVVHIRHPGAPLESSFGQTLTTDSWGFPYEQFEETILA